MWPAQMNYLSVVVAAVIYFVFGAVWYGVLGKTWMNAAGVTEQQVRETNSPGLYGSAAVISLLCALALCAVLRLVKADTLGDHICVSGLISASIAAAAAKHYAFLGRKPSLMLIDGGYDIIGYTLMAILFHFWR